MQQLLLGTSAQPAAPALARLVIFETVLAAVDGLAATRPIVLVFEDLHWADLGSIELLDHLARNIDPLSALVIATYRPDELEARPPARRVITEMRRLPSVAAI